MTFGDTVYHITFNHSGRNTKIHANNKTGLMEKNDAEIQKRKLLAHIDKIQLCLQEISQLFHPKKGAD